MFNDERQLEGQVLHLVLPANQADVNFCKTLVTIAALGYPTPTVLGWEKEYHNDSECPYYIDRIMSMALISFSGMMAGGSHLGKITETLKYLNTLDSSNDSDLVMLLDAYDIWLQLPSAILLSRYARLNKAADDLRAQQMGAAGNNHVQSIIFGAGKR